MLKRLILGLDVHLGVQFGRAFGRAFYSSKASEEHKKRHDILAIFGKFGYIEGGKLPKCYFSSED